MFWLTLVNSLPNKKYVIIFIPTLQHSYSIDKLFNYTYCSYDITFDNFNGIKIIIDIFFFNIKKQINFHRPQPYSTLNKAPENFSNTEFKVTIRLGGEASDV